ncbi:hypothetical protein ACFLW2_04555, partial [Chloroflexota bacterium]
VTEKDWLEGTVGIQHEDVKYFSQALIPDFGVVTVITGDIILDELENNLKDSGYELDSYQGIKMLVITGGDTDTAVALYKGVITGEKELVKKCIDVIKGQEGTHSLYEDPSIKEIADKLSGGIMIGLAKNEEMYEDLIGLGASVETKDDETFKVKAVYKFAVSGAAEDEDIQAEIEDNLTEIDLPAIKIECFEPKASSKDEFIEATASMKLDNFAYYAIVAETE